MEPIHHAKQAAEHPYLFMHYFTFCCHLGKHVESMRHFHASFLVGENQVTFYALRQTSPA